MAVSYEAFFPEVLPYVPDVAEPIAVNAIRNACIEFCERTLMWRSSFAVDLVEGQSLYTLPLPADARRAAVVNLYVEGRQCAPTGEDYLAGLSSQDWRLTEGAPLVYVEVSGGGVELAPIPTNLTTDPLPGALTGIQAFAPTRESLELGHDYIYNRWAEVIAHGALARLYGTPGSSYYMPDNALMREAKFRAGTAKAQAEVNAGNGRGRLAVSLKPFARGRNPWA